MDDIPVLKRELRRCIRSRIERLSAAQLRRKSRLIHERLYPAPWWQEASWIFAYIAMFGEVDTGPIVVRAYQEGKTVAIPRMEGEEIAFYRYEGRTRDLIPNQFGILEPDPQWIYVDPPRLDGGPLLILVPGVGFDCRLRRLGRGKGYYDRFLSLVRSSQVAARAVGLAFSEQLVEEVPVTPRDQPLDGLITDREIIT